MKLIRGLRHVEYFYRPSQVWRRLRKHSLVERGKVTLAWGLPIGIGPSSIVGADILNLGVYDRVVPEAICRLLDPGEQAFDVGANIGQNVSIMALVLGGRGRAVAFEPGPESWRLLEANVASWGRYHLSPITVVRKGVSSRCGAGLLRESTDLGGFSLEECPSGPPRLAPDSARGIGIDLTTLDDFNPAGAPIGFIKMDVEGHELAVLEGASRILRERSVRDIVFEDFHPQPSPVTTRLQAAGYEVFSLFPAWRNPVLLTLAQFAKLTWKDCPPNFLATCDPARVRARFAPGGWKCLRIRARLR